MESWLKLFGVPYISGRTRVSTSLMPVERPFARARRSGCPASRSAIIRSAISSRASSHVTGSNWGSMPRPFRGLRRRSGIATRSGSYSCSRVIARAGHTPPPVAALAALPRTLTARSSSIVTCTEQFDRHPWQADATTLRMARPRSPGSRRTRRARCSRARKLSGPSASSRIPRILGTRASALPQEALSPRARCKP